MAALLNLRSSQAAMGVRGRFAARNGWHQTACSRIRGVCTRVAGVHDGRSASNIVSECQCELPRGGSVIFGDCVLQLTGQQRRRDAQTAGSELYNNKTSWPLPERGRKAHKAGAAVLIA